MPQEQPYEQDIIPGVYEGGKIIKVCIDMLTEDGVAVLANILVWEGMEGFKDATDEDSGLEWQALSKIVPVKGGNKK